MRLADISVDSANVKSMKGLMLRPLYGNHGDKMSMLIINFQSKCLKYPRMVFDTTQTNTKGEQRSTGNNMVF